MCCCYILLHFQFTFLYKSRLKLVNLLKKKNVIFIMFVDERYLVQNYVHGKTSTCIMEVLSLWVDVLGIQIQNLNKSRVIRGMSVINCKQMRISFPRNIHKWIYLSYIKTWNSKINDSNLSEIANLFWWILDFNVLCLKWRFV